MPSQPSASDRLSPAELDRLLDAARTAPTYFGEGRRSSSCWILSGPERRLLYDLAATHSLPVASFRSVRVNDIDLESPALVVRGSVGMDSVRHPISRAMAYVLAELARDFRPGDPVFRLPHTGTLNLLLRRDLDAAGVPSTDARGAPRRFACLRSAVSALQPNRPLDEPAMPSTQCSQAS